jgi:hypothetical protein
MIIPINFNKVWLQMATHVNRSIWCKVDNPYLINFMIRTPILEWHMVCSGSNNGYQNTCNKIKNTKWIVCSKYDDYSQLNSEHDGGIFSLIMHEMFT